MFELFYFDGYNHNIFYSEHNYYASISEYYAEIFMLKVVIVGYDTLFANLITGCIAAGCEPVGVLRYEKVRYNPFILAVKDFIFPSKDKSFINGYNLHEINARSVNSEKFRNELLKMNADIVLIGSWGEKFDKKTADIPKIGTINCHSSLLPKYRGPNPYAAVILNNEQKTGITFHLVTDNYDSGAILKQTEVAVKPDDTGLSLRERCASVARESVTELLRELSSEIVVPVNQNEEKATYYPQFSEKDLLLNFDESSSEIDRRIRAFTPWTKCFIPHKNCYYTFGKHKIIDEKSEAKNGELLEKSSDELLISCGDNKKICFSNVKIYRKNILFTKLYTAFVLKKGDIMV